MAEPGPVVDGQAAPDLSLILFIIFFFFSINGENIYSEKIVHVLK